jgi:hypothetical protein
MNDQIVPDQQQDELTSVLLTKLHPPAAREQTLPRERLSALLRSGTGCKLTVVAAPAGSGKTTLLSAWQAAESANCPIGWLTLDDQDSDPVVLWSHAIEALHRACPTVGASLSAALVSSASVEDVLLPRLVNELAEQSALCLVLDDFHRLPSGAASNSLTANTEPDDGPATALDKKQKSTPRLPPRSPAAKARSEIPSKGGSRHVSSRLAARSERMKNRNASTSSTRRTSAAATIQGWLAG